MEILRIIINGNNGFKWDGEVYTRPGNQHILRNLPNFNNGRVKEDRCFFA